MRLSVLAIVVVNCFLSLAVGCSGSGPNTVNEPKEIKTIEQQMKEHESRAKQEAAEIKEQAQYN